MQFKLKQLTKHFSDQFPLSARSHLMCTIAETEAILKHINRICLHVDDKQRNDALSKYCKISISITGDKSHRGEPSDGKIDGSGGRCTMQFRYRLYL